MSRPWAPGADLELARRFYVGLARKRHEVMGEGRFWMLYILVVKPEYQGRGAGRLMIRWGAERADAEGLPCYVDSSPEAVGIYGRYGFGEVNRLVLKGEDHGGADLVNTTMVREARK